jgi:hypothetical protein
MLLNRNSEPSLHSFQEPMRISPSLPGRGTELTTSIRLRAANRRFKTALPAALPMRPELAHRNANHECELDSSIPEWRMARCPAWPWEQPVPPGCAGHGDSANPSSRQREHDGNVLHQDNRRGCPQRNDETGEPNCGGGEGSSEHWRDTRNPFGIQPINNSADYKLIIFNRMAERGDSNPR